MKLATFNVNGINGRLPVLLRWLEQSKPDAVCLQELKTQEDKFPAAAIEKAGYGAIWHLGSSPHPRRARSPRKHTLPTARVAEPIRRMHSAGPQALGGSTLQSAASLRDPGLAAVGSDK
jgi:hypothetical protein